MNRPASQEEYEINLDWLLEKASRGDREATDRLATCIRPILLRSVRGQGATLDDAEDAVGLTWRIMLRKLEEGRFKSMSAKEFIAYLRMTALNEWRHRPAAREGGRVGPLVYPDPHTGEEVLIEVPDPRGNTEEQYVRSNLHEFLLLQLDEVFVADKFGPERDRGEMEKLAFLSFYQDGMTQNEVYDMIALLSANYPEMLPITHADLNNWLSMGRSLKALLAHLARDHAELIALLMDLHLSKLELPEEEADTLRWVYMEGRDLSWVAVQMNLNLTEVKRILSSGKKALLEGLARTIKLQLRAARSSG